MTSRELLRWLQGVLAVVKCATLVWAVWHFGWLVLVPILIAVIQLDEENVP